MKNTFLLRPSISCLPSLFLALSAPIQAGETVLYPGQSLQTVNGISNSFAPSGSAGAVGASKSTSLSDNQVTVNNTGAVGGDVYGAINSLDTDAVANNQVLINSGGTVRNNIYGGYSDSGAVTGNSTTLNGGSSGNGVVGGFSGSGDAMGNSVTISNGASVDWDVLGGYSDTGEAVNNKVIISDATVGGSVYGGQGWGVSATDNSVTVSGGTVKGEAFGGFSSTGDAKGNSVTISDGASMDWGVYGGYSDSGDVADNHVTIRDGGMVERGVIGGRSDSGDVTGNSVTISGGRAVDSIIYSGMSTSGAVADNRVEISGGGAVDGDVRAGISNSGDVTNNSIEISDDSSVSGDIRAGSSYYGSAKGNSVIINDTAQVAGFVVGGEGAWEDGMGGASNNSVTLNGGSVGMSVLGGISISGVATGNRVVLRASSVDQEIIGGSGTAGAMGNSVTLDSGTVGWSVIGGYSNSGAATGNSVVISGGSVGGYVSGGYSDSGAATGNTVTYSGGAISGSVYGGFTSGSGDVFTGNTLNVKGAGLSVGGDLKNFQFLNFYLPSTMTAGTTALTVGGVADLTNGAGGSSTVNVGIEGRSSALRVGDTLTLIDAGTLTTESGLNTTANGQGMQGISLKYDFNILADNNKLLAAVTSAGVNPKTKALSEGSIAGLTFASQGGDLIAGPGMAALVAGADKQADSLTAFGVMSGGSSRYNTGSHVDVDGVSLMTGLGWRAPLAQNALRVGAFVEAGWGNYDSHNAFSNAASVNGSGDTHYYGLGMLARYELTDNVLKGLYADASLRAGRTATDFSSNDLRDALGRIARYDSHSSYYGAHAGIGYVWPLNDQSSLDFSSKYLWTRQGSDAVTVAGDPVRFDAADSSRWRNGVRFSHTLATAAGKPLSVYAGAYYEHEFDGKVNATTYGYAIDAPQLKGDTGIGELGLRYRPQAAGGFSLDAGIQGYVGDRRGISGSVRMMYAF